MNPSQIREFAASPAAFRDALLIDADTGPVPFGSVVDDWQRRDFEAADPGWLRCSGRKVDDAKSRCWFERPRGHSKSSDIATMATWALALSPKAISGVCAAADKDQAAIIRKHMQQILRLNPWLGATLQASQWKVTNTRNGSELEILSADAPSAFGLLPDFIICDELTHWPSDSLWVALFSAIAKRKTGLLVVISNAGIQEDWSWKLREAVRTDPAWHFSRLDGPVASWITRDLLAEQERLLPPSAYRRLWLNCWTSGTGDALQPGDIDRAVKHRLPEINPAEYVWCAGVDLSLKKDASAVVVVGRHVGGDGEYVELDTGTIDEWGEVNRDRRWVPGPERTDKYRVAEVRLWEPRRGERVNLTAIENAIIELNDRYQFASVAIDPWQAAMMTERLERRLNIALCHQTSQQLHKQCVDLLEAFQSGSIEIPASESALIADVKRLQLLERASGLYRLVSPRLNDPSEGTTHGDAASALGLAISAAKQVSSAPRMPTYADFARLI